jgi:hypothetical protein
MYKVAPAYYTTLYNHGLHPNRYRVRLLPMTTPTDIPEHTRGRSACEKTRLESCTCEPVIYPIDCRNKRCALLHFREDSDGVQSFGCHARVFSQYIDSREFWRIHRGEFQSRATTKGFGGVPIASKPVRNLCTIRYEHLMTFSD